MESKNHHIELLAINVNDHTEKKQNLTYLSWAWAWAEVIKRDVGANYEFKPVQIFGETMMVFCDVTIFNKTITAYLPVMDHRNKAINNPDAFAVNKAMMRCLAKGIALHGLGLYIYAGEDLPEEESHKSVDLGQLCAEYNEKADKCKTSKDLADWWHKTSAKSKEVLGEWYDKHKAYVADLGAALKESEAKETVKCPNDSKEIKSAYCENQCSKRDGCPVY